MKPIYLEGTNKTPKVLLEAENGCIEFSGRSIPEDSYKFFQPLLKWVNLYAESPCSKTTVNFNFEYFNTSTARCLLDLLKNLEIAKINGSDIEINWYYEEDDQEMLETCEVYESFIDIPFRRIKI